MNKQQEALRLALEALRDYRRNDDDRVSVAMGILQEALAESALERMAENARELGLDYEPPCKTGSQCTNKCQQCEQPAQQQEPIAWIERDMQCDDFDPDSVTCQKPDIAADGWEWVPLYITTPRKPWVGLTDEEKADLFEGTAPYYNEVDYADAIESKLREKNT